MADENPAMIRQWDRCNNIVISWLTSSLSPTIVESVQYSESAESIWKQLEHRYGTVNGTKIFEIKRKLGSTQQGSLDVASYFNKLKRLWDELVTMRKNHGNCCACAAKPGIQRDEEEDKLHELLMGLNEVYVGVRSNLLMMQPPPLLDSAYNILLQDESQRQVQFNPQLTPESASFNANVNVKQQFPPKQYNQKVDFDHSKGNMFCKYCKKPGHLIDKCYKLHGFPQNFKFNKGKRVVATVSADSAQFQPCIGSHVSAQPMAQTQINHAPEPQPNLMGSSNFAGSVLSLLVYTGDDSHACMFCSVSRDVWIIDSGATDHMTSNKEILSNLTPFPTPYLVTLPNGYKAKDLSMRKLLELGKVDQGLYKLLLDHQLNARLLFSASSTVSDSLFELIHVDTWGPYHTQSYFGAKYFLTIVDDHSRATWTHLLHSKSNAFTMLKAFISMVKTQFNLSVKKIRSDNALEIGLFNSALQYFSDNGIIHQTTCSHTPQQNGIVERKHKHLLEIARALMYQSKLPTKFWGDCILAATYLINRFPSTILHNKSPFEVLYGKLPSYSHLKPFGCLCYAIVPKCERNKFDPRVVPCVFVGYPFGKTGYKLYNLSTKCILVSRDVIFHESVFPFLLSSSSSSSYLLKRGRRHLQCSASIPISPVGSDPLLCTTPSHSFPVDPPSPNTSPSVDASSSPIPSVPSPNTVIPLDLPSTSAHSHSSSLPITRKSSRPHTLPSHLSDFVVKLPPSIFNSTTLSLYDAHTTEVEPHSYSQAATSLVWQESMRKEFEALEANNTCP
ncbi:PREDICTED: uncharacterized protein LOC109239486 [Nicotiana attenuata]|uniref:uncharacterized protein LOC109239486 n=1 Tax=Nicotiana attenuata TaxID=49451 RepID=UPI0009048DE0|nr:PREDICTED: uncharacterized protein LOC109239486 [Nicotiana attenuata]